MSKTELTKSLKLPFLFDVERLVQDLEAAMRNQWVPHFNTQGYDGDWNSLALYSTDGKATSIFAMNNDNAPLVETDLLQHCPYFREVITRFKCPLTSVRLLKLGVGAEIKPHSDYCLGYEDGTFRIHIPIVTNKDVEFLLDDDPVVMSPGECWYTNVNFVHSVANRGTEDRVHIVIDGERNAWSDELFFSLAPEESFIPADTEEHSKETLEAMIASLKNVEGEGARLLIEQFEKQLKELG